jgi:hypothetical protein
LGAHRSIPRRVAGGLSVEVSCGSGERAKRGGNQPVCGVESGAPVGVRQLSVGEGWCLTSADAELLREAHDAPLVLAVDAELVAGEEPLGRVPGAGCLDIGALLACLPAAGEHDRPVDGCALLAVDVLGVGETDVLKVFAAEV